MGPTQNDPKPLFATTMPDSLRLCSPQLQLLETERTPPGLVTIAQRHGRHRRIKPPTVRLQETIAMTATINPPPTRGTRANKPLTAGTPTYPPQPATGVVERGRGGSERGFAGSALSTTPPSTCGHTDQTQRRVHLRVPWSGDQRGRLPPHAAPRRDLPRPPRRLGL